MLLDRIQKEKSVKRGGFVGALDVADLVHPVFVGETLTHLGIVKNVAIFEEPLVKILFRDIAPVMYDDDGKPFVQGV